MKSYNEHSPQERVFIDYDRSKDYYPGDTVFFSAKVVRTDNMKASDYSGVLYVELLNGNNVKVDMQKLLLEDGVAKGRLVVDATYGSGFYYIFAYTRYQTNWKTRKAQLTLPVCCPDSLVSPVLKKKNPGAKFLSFKASPYSSKLYTTNGLRAHIAAEGGRLVAGLPGTLVVHVTDYYSVPIDAEVELRSDLRERIKKGKVDKYGNIDFKVTPQPREHFSVIVKGNRQKQEYEVSTMSSYVGLHVDHFRSDSVFMNLRLPSKYEDSLLCMVVMNHGNILVADSFVVNGLTRNYTFSKRFFDRGVNEVIVFDTGGKQCAFRRFFVGDIRNAEDQWMLLEAELDKKTVLPYDAYKTLSANDIDRMLIANGESPYHWENMASRPWVTFVQPKETQPLIFGKIKPKALNPKRADYDYDGKRFKLTVSRGDTIFKSDIVVDSNGMWATSLPNLKGDWMLMAHNSEDMKRHMVLLQNCEHYVTSHLDNPDIDARLFGATKWVDSQDKTCFSALYDCALYTSASASVGRISESFYKWLDKNVPRIKRCKGVHISPVMSNVMPDTTYNKFLDYNFLGTSSDDPRTVCVDGPTFETRPIVWIIDGEYRMVTGLKKMITDFKVLRPSVQHMPSYVDEVKSVYVTEDPKAFYPYVRCSVLESKNPLTIFIKLTKNYVWNDRGLLTTPYHGIDN